MRFDIVDVFAEAKYAGNQLAIVRDAAALSTAQMQAIARETNFSETTFVIDDKPTVRIFTPGSEIPFAGHPTLGTAALLMGDAPEITLHLGVGPIRVARDRDVYWMTQRAPSFGATRSAAELAPVVGLREDEIAGPVEEVSTGLPFLVVPVASLDALRRVRIDLPRYWALIEKMEAKSIACFARGPGADVTTRVFPISYGIPEDPATGSAAGCLGAYLVKHKTTGADALDLRLHQGEQIGRPSLLLLRADATRIEVGGRVQRVVEGRLVL